MTKSKSFWAALALISLAVMVFAGYSIYERITLHFSGDTIEVHPVPMPPPQEEEEESAEAPQAAAPAKADKKEEKKAEEPKSAEKAEPARIKAVKTTFEYKDPKAKSVEIAGSFTSWKLRDMKKKDGAWKADIYILPGTYPFHFMVDGKKKAAPGAPKSPVGDSLVTVQ